MSNFHGTHIMVDYTGFFPTINDVETWILSLMERIVDDSSARRVHSHVETFDGNQSPPGFAAVVLLDESHLTAHCYSTRGWLAVDCFTCGSTDTGKLIDELDVAIREVAPNVKLERKQSNPRFIHR